jgi:hypothetical protein
MQFSIIVLALNMAALKMATRKIPSIKYRACRAGIDERMVCAHRKKVILGHPGLSLHHDKRCNTIERSRIEDQPFL